MSRMALLTSTDDWDKMTIYQRFLAGNAQAIWRRGGNNSQEYLNRIPYPVNLYFFHRSVVKFRARCIGISRGNPSDWPLTITPPEFRGSRTPYTMAITIDRLEGVRDTHISKFPKWDRPKESYQQGGLPLYSVQDIYETTEESDLDTR